MKTATSSDPDRTAVASDVMTMCTKEKIDTWHVVQAHNARGAVERVKCKSCGSEHKYKSKNPLLIPRKSSSSPARKVTASQTYSAATRSSGSAASIEEGWLAGIKKWGNKEVRDFTPDQSFKVGEVFSHSVFGKGVVQGRRENKVDVLFQEGMKTLPSKLATSA
jgi:hypothetical protein